MEHGNALLAVKVPLIVDAEAQNDLYQDKRQTETLSSPFDRQASMPPHTYLYYIFHGDNTQGLICGLVWVHFGYNSKV